MNRKLTQDERYEHFKRWQAKERERQAAQQLAEQVIIVNGVEILVRPSTARGTVASGERYQAP